LLIQSFQRFLFDFAAGGDFALFPALLDDGVNIIILPIGITPRSSRLTPLLLMTYFDDEFLTLLLLDIFDAAAAAAITLLATYLRGFTRHASTPRTPLYSQILPRSHIFRLRRRRRTYRAISTSLYA
jgi:hypothetical protein